MIRIGLNEKQKQEEIRKYVLEHDIKNVIVFSPKKMLMDLPELDVPIRQIDYDEIIMYRTFYPLLEEIDNSYLLVANELMRDRNRSCLTYNCYAKYTNQTEHRIVFNYLPIIESRKDIMILVDFSNSQAQKGFGIADINLEEYDIQCIRKDYRIDVISVLLPDGATEEYEEEKERLFDDLGSKDPDTVPRQLHAWTGKFKKPFLEDGEMYIARNKRIKGVEVFKNAMPGNNYILIDMPFRRLDFNDFLQASQQDKIRYLSTGFGVDSVYIKAFEDWVKEVKSIYAETGVYKG